MLLKHYYDFSAIVVYAITFITIKILFWTIRGNFYHSTHFNVVRQNTKNWEKWYRKIKFWFSFFVSQSDGSSDGFLSPVWFIDPLAVGLASLDQTALTLILWETFFQNHLHIFRYNPQIHFKTFHRNQNDLKTMS